MCGKNVDPDYEKYLTPEADRGPTVEEFYSQNGWERNEGSKPAAQGYATFAAQYKSPDGINLT